MPPRKTTDTPETGVAEEIIADAPVTPKRYAHLPTRSGPPVSRRDGMARYALELHLDSYIGHPYWPEREQVINITKQSGMSRARSDENRQKALNNFLKEHGLTPADFERLQEVADRPFHLDDDGLIIVPELHVISMIVAACDQARSAQRPIQPDQVRSSIMVTPWATGKKEPDAVWERFAVVTTGTGQKLSNQRALRINPFIENTMATGEVALNQLVSPDKFRKLLEYAGTDVGIGASRPMGFGRFQVVSMDKIG